jgi:hypothetical protein
MLGKPLGLGIAPYQGESTRVPAAEDGREAHQPG